MAYYELREGSSHWFLNIFLAGKTLVREWGEYGGKSERDSFDYPDAAKARAERDGYISEYTKQGYVLARSEKPPCEDGEDTSHTAWRNPELEAAIEKDPDNLEGYLVYGDWLQSQGDPRGELIALQCAAHQASADEAQALQLQVTAWVREHERFLLGELTNEGETNDTQVKVEWRFGFIRSVRLSEFFHHKNNFSLAETVRALRTLPSARFLRELTVGNVGFEVFNDGHFYEGMDYGEVVSALAEGPWPTLERLFIGDFYSAEISWAHLQDLSPLYEMVPRLRALKLCGGDLELGEVDLPELREFTVESGGLPLEAVRSIVKARWPKLERLEVWFGVDAYGAGGDEKDLQPLLDGQGLPNLKHLGLCNASFTHRLVAMLPEARILPQLDSLDLSKGTLEDKEAVVLARHVAAFRHLKHLDVTQNALSVQGQEALARLCESVATGSQQNFPIWDEGSDQRYAAVGEWPHAPWLPLP